MITCPYCRGQIDEVYNGGQWISQSGWEMDVELALYGSESDVLSVQFNLDFPIVQNPRVERPVPQLGLRHISDSSDTESE